MHVLCPRHESMLTQWNIKQINGTTNQRHPAQPVLMELTLKTALHVPDKHTHTLTHKHACIIVLSSQFRWWEKRIQSNERFNPHSKTHTHQNMRRISTAIWKSHMRCAVQMPDVEIQGPFCANESRSSIIRFFFVCSRARNTLFPKKTDVVPYMIRAHHMLIDCAECAFYCVHICISYGANTLRALAHSLISIALRDRGIHVRWQTLEYLRNRSMCKIWEKYRPWLVTLLW